MNADERHNGCDIDGLVLIAARMGHHAGASGYDRLTNVLHGELLESYEPRSLSARAFIKLLTRLARRSGSQWYHRSSLLAELAAARRWIDTRRHLYHFLYAENSYRYAGWLRQLVRRDNWLVGTYHTPGWRTREVVRDTRHIQLLDAIVVVSTAQIDYFAELLEPERVFFVPHGIDTDYFCPSAGGAPGPGRRFICVGHHLRDFETVSAVARAVGQRYPDAEFLVVARSDRLGPLRNQPNVTCYSSLSDADLLSLYQSCHALLLPLLDSTANNALLEGMACGLPVLSTDLQGVRDYTQPDCAVLLPKGDHDAYIHAALRVCAGELDLRAMSAASRLTASHFSWPRVAAAMRNVYRCVASREPRYR